MSDAAVAHFRALVDERFRFLDGCGIRRSPGEEHDSPSGASVVYAGKHVGFVISYDVRDAQVDVRVARVRDGRLAGIGEAGHPRDLLGHLVEHAGYRGGGSRGKAATAEDEWGPLERMVGWWADLLRVHGAALLADTPDALPEG